MTPQTPAELKTALIGAATQYVDERVPANIVDPVTRELVIYLMTGFACATMLKYLLGEDA